MEQYPYIVLPKRNQVRSELNAFAHAAIHVRQQNRVPSGRIRCRTTMRRRAKSDYRFLAFRDDEPSAYRSLEPVAIYRESWWIGTHWTLGSGI